MLQNIRDRATGWIAYVIVIGISIPFALWGIDQYFTGGNIIVAEVNDTKISAERLNGEYQDRLREMQSIISKDEDEAELQKKIIKRTVLDELIDSVIVREFVNENKFQISEKSLIFIRLYFVYIVCIRSTVSYVPPIHNCHAPC